MKLILWLDVKNLISFLRAKYLCSKIMLKIFWGLWKYNRSSGIYLFESLNILRHVHMIICNVWLILIIMMMMIGILLKKWIKVALISNMRKFYIRYQILWLKFLIESFWTKTFIPESSCYLVLFDRINTLIDLLFGELKDYRLILNAIRFGPNDPDFYETRIRPNRFVVDQFIHVHASLSNKFNLFEKFTCDYGTSSLSKNTSNNAIMIFKIFHSNAQIIFRLVCRIVWGWAS